MEIFGGFMVMMSILGFFLAIIWLIMPFVVLTIKGKLDKTLEMLDGINTRLTAMERQLVELRNARPGAGNESPDPTAESPVEDGGRDANPLPLA